jgi:hypothetical protein
MKKAWVWVCALALLAALVACQQPVSPPAGEADADAAAKTTALINAVVEGRATGDMSAVEAILQEDDPNGELREVLAESGALAPAAARSATNPLPLEDLWTTPGVGLQTGDVLVCRGSGTLSSNLMDLVLVNGYGHAGILDTSLLEPTGGHCILSADVDYLLEGTGEALNYENFADWAANDVVTLLRPKTVVSDMKSHIDDIAGFRNGHTVYAFLGYPGAVVGAFKAIPRTDPKYWYCSKVPWRVYDLAGVNIEDSGFYFEFLDSTTQRWNVIQQSSVLYKVYVFYLKLLHPWWSLAKCANQAAVDIQAVLGDLISPDELRASDRLERKATLTVGGLCQGDDAALVGWPVPYY